MTSEIAPLQGTLKIYRRKSKRRARARLCIPLAAAAKLVIGAGDTHFEAARRLVARGHCPTATKPDGMHWVVNVHDLRRAVLRRGLIAAAT